MDWQTIDNAPKDGTLILFYLAKGEAWCPYTVASWSERNEKWYGYSANAAGVIEKGVTHWAPLSPPAPR